MANNFNNIDEDIDEDFSQSTAKPVNPQLDNINIPENFDMSSILGMMNQLKSMKKKDLQKMAAKMGINDKSSLDKLISLTNQTNQINQTNQNNSEENKQLTREELRKKLRNACNMKRMQRSSKDIKEQQLEKITQEQK